MRHPARERRRLTALRRSRPELSEALAFLEAVANTAERFTPKSFDLSDLDEPLAGFSPLFPALFPLDRSAAAQAFRELLEAFVDATGSQSAKRTLVELEAGRLDAGALARAYCQADAQTIAEAARRGDGLDPEFLINLAELAVKPQFIAAARALEARGLEVPERTDRCPACGSPPDLTYVADRENAERVAVAVCRLCETEWPIKRIRCLHCGNEDVESLAYLQAEGEDAERASVCNKCHHYLLVLDTRGRLEIAAAVERTALAHLDLVAQGRGYEPLSVLLAQTVGGVPD